MFDLFLNLCPLHWWLLFSNRTGKVLSK